MWLFITVLVVFLQFITYSSSFSICSADDRLPIDLIIAIDESGSMGGNDPDYQRITASVAILQDLLKHDRASACGWDTEPESQYEIDLTEDIDSVIALVESTRDERLGGGTNIEKALQWCVDEFKAFPRGKKDDAIPAVVLLTDGDGSYVHCSDSSSACAQLASLGAAVFSVGLKTSSSGSLAEISDFTNGTYIQIDDSSSMVEAFEEQFEIILNSASFSFACISLLTILLLLVLMLLWLGGTFLLGVLGKFPTTWTNRGWKEGCWPAGAPSAASVSAKTKARKRKSKKAPVQYKTGGYVSMGGVYKEINWGQHGPPKSAHPKKVVTWFRGFWLCVAWLHFIFWELPCRGVRWVARMISVRRNGYTQV